MTASSTPHDNRPRVRIQWVRDKETTLKLSIDVIDPVVADALSKYTIVRMPDDVIHVYEGNTDIMSSYGLNQGRKLVVVLRQLAYILLLQEEMEQET